MVKFCKNSTKLLVKEKTRRKRAGATRPLVSVDTSRLLGLVVTAFCSQTASIHYHMRQVCGGGGCSRCGRGSWCRLGRVSSTPGRVGSAVPVPAGGPDPATASRRRRQTLLTLVGTKTHLQHPQHCFSSPVAQYYQEVCVEWFIHLLNTLQNTVYVLYITVICIIDKLLVAAT